MLTLATATPIKITATSVGDTSVSILQVLADGDFQTARDYFSPPLKTSLGKCLAEGNSNAAYTGCFLDVEESLQRKVRSLVSMQISKEKEMSYAAYDTNPALFADELKGYWQEWYIRNTSKGGIKSVECEIDGTRAFGNSGWYEVMSKCYIKHAAADILWLLNQREEREKSFKTN